MYFYETTPEKLLILQSKSATLWNVASQWNVNYIIKFTNLETLLIKFSSHDSSKFSIVHELVSAYLFSRAQFKN
jgi:hypothetical protein